MKEAVVEEDVVYVINLTLQGRRRESGAKTEFIHYN